MSQKTTLPDINESPPFSILRPLPEIPVFDYTLSELQLLDTYILNKIPLQRLVHVKHITEIIKRAGLIDSTFKIILPLIHVKGILCTDTEFIIRKALAEELADIADYFMDKSTIANEDGIVLPFDILNNNNNPYYHYILSHFLPSLIYLATDPSNEVSSAAAKSLVRVSKHLIMNDLERSILCMVLCIAHEDHEDQRSTAVSLLNDLAYLLGTNLCTNFVSHELVSMSEDPCFRVRKATAASFSNVCGVVGVEYATSKLLPAFLKLAKDSIWSVRKSCVENLVKVGKKLSLSTRVTVFVPLLEQLTKDVSRWVRNSSYEIIGPFMATLDNASISSSFLKQFAQIPKLSSAIIDTEICFFCAFNFPAILLTVGPLRWSELSDSYKSLCRDTKFNVRKTLACSLHEIARIFKPVYHTQANAPDIIKNSILPTFELFFRDIEEVKTGAIEQLGHLLEALPEVELRNQFLQYLWELQSETDNHWRFRKLLAQQLLYIYKLYPLNIVSDSLVRITLILLRDKIAAVRQVAALSIGALFFRLSSPEFPEFVSSNVDLIPHVELLTTDLLKLAASGVYSERQLYIRICAAAFTNDLHYGVTSKYLLSKFLELTQDKVSNVRLLLARSISEIMMSNKIFASDPSVIACVEILSKDEDELISFYFPTKTNSPSGDVDPTLVSTIVMETKLHHSADMILHETEYLDIEPPLPEKIAEVVIETVSEIIRSQSPKPEFVPIISVTSESNEEKLILHPKFEEQSMPIVDAAKPPHSPSPDKITDLADNIEEISL